MKIAFKLIKRGMEKGGVEYCFGWWRRNVREEGKI
jgi:hypothetical protein